MGRLGKGYGSEYHLLEYRKREPQALDAAILAAMGAKGASLEWLYPTPDGKAKEPITAVHDAGSPDEIEHRAKTELSFSRVKLSFSEPRHMTPQVPETWNVSFLSARPWSGYLVF